MKGWLELARFVANSNNRLSVGYALLHLARLAHLLYLMRTELPELLCCERDSMLARFQISLEQPVVNKIDLPKEGTGNTTKREAKAYMERRCQNECDQGLSGFWRVDGLHYYLERGEDIWSGSITMSRKRSEGRHELSRDR